LVIEAIFENIDMKKEVFQRLDSVCKPETIYASNTSSIPITKLAMAVTHPDKFVGMHFFSPVPVMKLVEVIKGFKTSLETIIAVEGVVVRLGKESVRVKDVPGFLVNRLNYALRCEAYNLLRDGVASMEDIDKATKLGLRHPMGPFELADFVGLDVNLNGVKTLYENYGEIKWKPSMILEKLVINGELGRKTGKGWYDYTFGEKKPRTDIEF
jgi:3-hydroxybutyryl-CoA dehydrogenase